MNDRKINLDQFHLLNKEGKPTGVYDFRIFQYLCEKLDLFILGSIPYIYQNGIYKPDLNGSRLKTEIRKLIYPQLIRSYTTDRIYKLFIDAAELQAEEKDLNLYPPHWIPFKNGYYDPIKRQMFPHSPSYKAINQLPHEYIPYKETEGKEVDKWLQFIAEDPEDREMLLQYCGLCMTRDVRQQKFMILNGSGGSGKSTLIRMIEHVIGEDNIASISLKELSQRFASYGLMGKILNSCADLEVTALEDTSLIKKILGEDLIRAEAKGKNAVFFRSYAKLIFSTNELPAVLSEKTNGFYRRLLILTMDKQPETVRPDYLEVLKGESDHFIQLCVKALQRLYESGTICESSNSKEAVESMRCDSDSVQAWIHDDCITEDPEARAARIERNALFKRYAAYCERTERKALTAHNFYKSLRLKGFKDGKDGRGARYFAGLLPLKVPDITL